MTQISDARLTGFIHTTVISSGFPGNGVYTVQVAIYPTDLSNTLDTRIA